MNDGDQTFNSSKVQLEPVTSALAVSALRSFNSSKVQLEPCVEP